jgi:hypothetical protein
VSIDGERGDWTEHESLRLGGCGGGDMGWWTVAHVIGISFLDVEFAPHGSPARSASIDGSQNELSFFTLFLGSLPWTP